MFGIFGAAALGVVASAASATTLDDVKAKGFLQCGVSTGLAGFSAPNDQGDWLGLDADYCRAVAAAIFGDGTKVKFTPLSAKERFTALQSGEIDHSVAQHDMDYQPRHRARHEFCRRDLL